MSKKLTIKQRKFIRAYIKTGNATQAAKDAGYLCKSDEAYSEMGYRLVRNVESKMCEILVEAGIDNSTLAKKIEEGLNAMIVKPFAHEGVVISEPAYIDFSTRAKYLEIVAKIKGLLKEKIDKTVSGTIKIEIKGRRADSKP
jgi:phage terminase small subunit